MVHGFIADFAYDSAVVRSWVPGTSEKSFWTGLKIPEKIPGRHLPVLVLRLPGIVCPERV